MIKKCVNCGKSFDLDVSKEQFADWKAGALIQNAMPNLTPGERELFLSGMCDICFDLEFGLEGALGE